LPDYKHIDVKLVNQAVEDRINGNRPFTSRAYLDRRIAEIRYDRIKEHEEFIEFFTKVYMKVKE
jgi:hypothetical protein